jgi:adenylosuccinate lyase
MPPQAQSGAIGKHIGIGQADAVLCFGGLEDVALWHERDISHSSVERVIGPDATIVLDFMLGRFTQVMEMLIVYPERMMKNLNMTHGVIFHKWFDCAN